MISIRRINPDEVPAALEVIIREAYNIFGFEGSLEDSRNQFVSSGAFEDLDDIQRHYLQAGGTFLAVLDDGVVVGCGAIRKMDDTTAELRRMWLQESYQGRGIGYRLITQLIAFARAQKYLRMVLQTSPAQTRALAFYRRVGFREIPTYNDDVDEISLELSL
jgi:GNAT superfamily N-acetyltransferase